VLNFAAGRGDNATQRAALTPHQAAVPAASADSRESFGMAQELIFCALSDVKPTRIFSEQHARSWSEARVCAWQKRLHDIHHYMMQLPFPHEGASTTLHQSQQWSRCESDRLLSVIDDYIR
jgi:hypothetical protein